MNPPGKKRASIPRQDLHHDLYYPKVVREMMGNVFAKTTD